MKLFLRISGLAFLVQAAFIGQMLLTGIGEGVVFVVYGGPFFLVDLSGKLLGHIAGGSDFALYLYFCGPAAIYALLLGGIVSMFGKQAKDAENR